jgi:hypothetical protein
MRDRREKLYAEARSLRAAMSDYQRALKKEMDYSKPQLPSDCEQMIKMWEEFLAAHPGSIGAELARERKKRWEAKLKQEIERGFYISIDGADVRSAKGPSHRLMAGRPWDPEIAGPTISLPDPYAVLKVDGEPVIYTQPARDTLKADWRGQAELLRVNDGQTVIIAVRDRDVAEKAALLALGNGLFSFSGIDAVREAMSRDDDDDICNWRGTVRELIEKGGAGLPATGDCVKLRAKVTRSR